MSTLNLSAVSVVTIAANSSQALSVPSVPGTIWRIESAGIGGTNGALYLQSPVNVNIAILISTVKRDDYSVVLPYWLPAGFSGYLNNDSAFPASVSITEYLLV